MPEITFPHLYTPRWYQLPLWEYMQKGGFRKKRAAVVWHRRGGKDLNAIHLINTAGAERPGLYWHLFPTYAQGKKIAWDGKTKDGKPFRDAFPASLISGTNHTEMKITLKTGVVYQVVGADKPDSLVGANPVGIVMSEWSLMNPSVWEFLRPILAENEGWILFIFTPRGRNHGHKLIEMAKKNGVDKGGRWFWEILPNSYTGVVSDEEIEELRKEGMTEEMIAQEMECSFDAPLEGAYYAKILDKAEAEGRIGKVPWEPKLQVHTAWDLGIGDYMAIWFYQVYGQEIRVIDYYQNCGEGLAHYAKILKEKDYVYGTHYAPHDIKVRELGTGVTRLETARSLGIKFIAGKQLPIDEGIEAVRCILPKCWIDASKCEIGLEGLRSYHKEYDEERKVFRDKPEHDWSSHPADAFRELAQSLKIRPKYQQRPQEKAIYDYDPMEV